MRAKPSFQLRVRLRTGFGQQNIFDWRPRPECPEAGSRALSGGDPDRPSRRHYLARAGDVGRRRHHRLRGYPNHPPPDRALCDLGRAEAVSRAQRGDGAAENPGEAGAGRLDRAGVGRRHALDLGPRLQAGARGLRRRPCRDRGARRVLGADGALGRGAADRPVFLRGIFAGASRSRGGRGSRSLPGSTPRL